MDLNNPYTLSQDLSTNKVNPNVLNCGTGYHWDYYLKKCVADCPTGYHNDSITGACVVTGGGTGIIVSYAGVNITYFSNSHILSFNNTSDVNTVLNQLDADYENYNEAYENQYPNYTALQLDSLDSVNNFDELRTYRDFEGQFAAYTSQRAVLENIETTWMNNNFTGPDPDSIDYTIDNSENAICNSNYQVMIAGSTYQWTSSGLVVVGLQSASSNAQTGCFTNRHRKIPYFTPDQARKVEIKVAVNFCILRGEAKGKVVSYKRKSNGGYKHSRLDLEVNAQGNIYDDSNCLGLVQVGPRTPAQGYLKRRELKTYIRFTDQTYTESGQFQAGFLCPSLGFSGTVTLL